MDNVWQLVVAFVVGGGLTGLITAVSNRNKNRADITADNIKTAILLKNEAVKEYNAVDDKLREVRKLLDEVQEELDIAKEYINTLVNILDENNIKYPPMPEVEKGGNHGRHQL